MHLIGRSLALAVLLGSAAEVSAQSVSVQFQDGLVKVTAQNATVPRILSEWARVGAVQIINGERVPGAPITIELVDVPENRALDVLLRGAAGYIVGARETDQPGAARFDRIRILPTTSRAPAASSLPPSPAAQESPVELTDEPNVGDNPDPGANPLANPRLPPGFTNPEALPPTDAPLPEENAEPEVPGIEVAPGNPFGVVPGSGQPGAISPIARPQATPAPGR